MASLLTWSPLASAQNGSDGAAQPDEAKRKEAKKWFDEGTAYFAQGSYDEAITAWEKSYELSQEPLIFDSISNAYERLGDLEQAVYYLKLWRDEAPAKELPVLDKRISNLEARIKKNKPKEPPKPDDKPDEQPDTPREPSGGSTPWTGIVLTSVGGAAVVTGVILGAVGAGQRPEESEACNGSGGKSLCLGDNKDDIETSSTLAGIGDLVWIAGAVTAAVGVVLIITHDPGPANFGEAPSPSISLSVGPTSAFVQGTF